MLVDNLDNVLGADSANNQFASTNVVPNADGSILERLEYVQRNMNGTGIVYNAPNYIQVPITFAALTTGSVATHEILTVTGMVRLRILAECTVNVAGAGSIQLGVEGTTNAFIASTLGTDIDAGECWMDATPTETYGNFSSLILDKVVVGGLDVGYEVTGDTLTGGTVIFHCWYEPLNSTGAVVAADGTATL
jgi:hypothetical protein